VALRQPPLVGRELPAHGLGTRRAGTAQQSLGHGAAQSLRDRAVLEAQVRQALKYIAINSVGSTLFVVGCGVVYATVGTLNMADLAVRTAEITGQRAGMVTAASMLLLLVFALKAAVFPLIYWLPDSYPVVPPGVNGYFAGILTKVGVYSLLRVFVLCFRQEGHQFALDVLLFLSGLTMLLGVLGAMCRWDIRRILSWHIISQVGYMVMGIGLPSQPSSTR